MMIRLDQRSDAALATTLVAAPDTFNDGCEAPGGPDALTFQQVEKTG